MIIGFTGTQLGMTSIQKDVIMKFILDLDKSLVLQGVRHGDCIGADEEFHNLVKDIGLIIVIHPPENESKRAFCKADACTLQKPYLDRNKDIVDGCDTLIACPGTEQEQVRSGTWSTVRYAKKKGKSVFICYPSGRIETIV